MRIEIVAAMTPQMVIGKNGSMPWPKIQSDLARFYNLTYGSHVVMGRKTWESLPPAVRPLKHRVNLVISRKMLPNNTCIVLDNPNKVFPIAHANRVFVVGGADIYKQFLPFADVMHITWVYQDYEGDTHFPMPHDKFDQWKMVANFKDKTKWGIAVDYSTYHKKFNVAKPPLNLV